MTPKEIFEEIDSMQLLMDVLKDKAARLKVQLGRFSGPAPKGAQKKSPLTNDQIANVIARRRKTMYNQN